LSAERRLKRAVASAVIAFSAAACGPPPPTTHAVEIRTFVFGPDTIRVRLGDTVSWTNHDLFPHTATAEGGEWDTGAITENKAGRWVPERRGSHPYVCAYHPTMRGMVVVE
jgi:plastocyanin